MRRGRVATIGFAGLFDRQRRAAEEVKDELFDGVGFVEHGRRPGDKSPGSQLKSAEADSRSISQPASSEL